MPDQEIVLVGGGNMGRALLRGVLGAGVAPKESVSVVDVRPETRDALSRELGIRAEANLSKVVPSASVVILAVKPFSLGEVLDELAPLVTPEHLIISIVAGAEGSDIRDRLGKRNPVVRVMPNLAATVDAAASAMAACPPAGEEHLAVAERIFSSVGVVVRVSEDQIDAVTGLSGSGPAYVFLVIEALSDGAVDAGLPRDVALALATQTVLGAAKVVQETGLHPAVLKDQVTTPGGTTIAGLRELERSGVRGAFLRAVGAATERARDLKKAAKPKARD